jgi:membrane protein required for colicin V production
LNWIDIILLILLIAAVIVGSKKGLIRELMALAVLAATVILSIGYIDRIAIIIYEQLGGSPLVTAIISFVVLLAVIYAVFKLLAILFYKVANLQKLGKKDQLGGALVGAVRGWIIISFLVFIVFLFPMPDKFYSDFGSSFLGPTFARTLPLMYNTTSGAGDGKADFMAKVENTLLLHPTGGLSRESKQNLSKSKEEVYRVVYQIDRFFGSGKEKP